MSYSTVRNIEDIDEDEPYSFRTDNDSLIDILANYPSINYETFAQLYNLSYELMLAYENMLFMFIINLTDPTKIDATSYGILFSLILLTIILNTNFYYRMIPNQLYGATNPDLIYGRLLLAFNKPENLIDILSTILNAHSSLDYSKVHNLFAYILQLDANFVNFFGGVIIDVYLSNTYNYPKDWSKLSNFRSQFESPSVFNTQQAFINMNKSGDTLESIGVIVSTSQIVDFHNNILTFMWSPFLTIFSGTGQIPNPLPIPSELSGRRFISARRRGTGVPNMISNNYQQQQMIPMSAGGKKRKTKQNKNKTHKTKHKKNNTKKNKIQKIKLK